MRRDSARYHLPRGSPHLSPSNTHMRQSGTLCLLLALGAAGRADAQSPLADSLVKRIDAVFARYGSLDAPGCAVGVFQGGRIAMEKGYGSANIEYRVPITPTRRSSWARCRSSSPRRRSRCSSSRDASRSTTTFAIRAGAAGLRQDDHDRPSRPSHERHSRFLGALSMPRACVPTTATPSTTFSRSPSRQKHLNFDPGAEYNYSNTGYVLLGVIVQRVTGKTLRQFAPSRSSRRWG